MPLHFDGLHTQQLKILYQHYFKDSTKTTHFARSDHTQKHNTSQIKQNSNSTNKIL